MQIPASCKSHTAVLPHSEAEVRHHEFETASFCLCGQFSAAGSIKIGVGVPIFFMCGQRISGVCTARESRCNDWHIN